MMTPSSKIQCSPTRRRFLKRASLLGLSTATSSTLTGALMMGSGSAYAATDVPELDAKTSRRIHLINAHTGDDLNVVYYTHGIYIDENIEQLNHLMRDRRANASMQMDTGLYDQLLRLQLALGSNTPVHILSGYRTPETNAKLRRRSPGVAKFSLHMEGRAADIFMPDVSVAKLHEAATAMKAGGVGLYSNSNFVHIDTGAVRRWGS